jgi:hypothetical protein
MAHRLHQPTRTTLRGGCRARFLTSKPLHFIGQPKPTNEYLVILVLDGNYSHTRNTKVISLAREHRVDIICLLLLSSHKIQPLYKAFTGPLHHSTTKKLKNSFVQTQGESSPFSKLANYSEMHTNELQLASSG